MTKTRVEAVKAARVWCLAALLAFAGLAHAELVGPVVAIQDGDTIDVLVNRQPVRVRLAQIDAPEKRQAFGTRSRQALAELVFRQSVRVAETGCLQPVRLCSRMTAAAGTCHSSSCDATDRSTFSNGHPAAMGRTRCRATPSRQGDRLFATRCCPSSFAYQRLLLCTTIKASPFTSWGNVDENPAPKPRTGFEKKIAQT